MGYEYVAEGSNSLLEEIRAAVERICLNADYLEVVSRGTDYWNVKYRNKTTLGNWDADIYIEVSEEHGLYILFNLGPDEKFLFLLQNELVKINDGLQLEEL